MYANEETLNKCMEQMAGAMRGVYKIYEMAYDNVEESQPWWFDAMVDSAFLIGYENDNVDTPILMNQLS